MVVAPGCPAQMLQDLLGAGVLAGDTRVDVLLPWGDVRPYAQLLDGPGFAGTARLLLSPSRHFFSPRHLYWLWENLWPCPSNLLLAAASPCQDPATALLGLSVLALAGKGIKILFLDPDALPDETRPGSAGGWRTWELNARVLLKQLVRVCGFLKLWEQSEAGQVEPANLKPVDSSPAAIDRDVEYALGNADLWIYYMPGREAFPKGKRVLEIGPGVNLGSILTLACYGAEVQVVERFSSPWNPDYHPKFYARLRERLAERGPLLDLTPLDMIISRGCYPPESVTIHYCSLEELSGVPEASFDLVFSNAVFEHLYDIRSAFAHLARITKPGGLGLHQVDFRDHRDLSRPLEHLILSDREFSRVFKGENCECGNRFRPDEMRQLLEAAGFEVREIQPNLDTEAGYLEDFLGRLRQARNSRYRNYDAHDLRYVSGLFIVVRKDT
jgi:SAM-dependent methyltransferase